MTPPVVSTVGRGPLSGAPAFWQARCMQMSLLDGFNLYYGCIKGSRRKLLDLIALFKRLLQPHHRIAAVKCFMARVSGTPNDPSKPQRQDVYLWALQQFRSDVEIYFGHFLNHRVRMPLANPLTGGRPISPCVKLRSTRWQLSRRRTARKWKNVLLPTPPWRYSPGSPKWWISINCRAFS